MTSITLNPDEKGRNRKILWLNSAKPEFIETYVEQLSERAKHT